MSASAHGPIAPNYAKVDTERWRCRLCPFESADSKEATWTLGVIHVDDASARFGRDSGLDEAGMRVDAGLAYRRRDERGRTVTVDARRLGLDSRTLAMAIQGSRTRLRFDRRDIPRNVSTDGVTPFTVDGTRLGLPGRWTPAFDTADLAGLREAVPFDHATQRRRTTFHVRADPRPDWWIEAGYSRETKSGTERTFADFLYQSSGLPKPVGFLTEEVAASTGLERDSFTIGAELRNSRFRNRNRFLDWQNPWRGPSVDRGRKALAPDNATQSLTLVSRIAFGGRTTAHATLTWGDTRQDDAFDVYTTNTRLALEPLPANSLDGRARSFAGTVNLLARPTDRLRLTVRHTQRERNNLTGALTFEPVRGDAFRLGPVTNRPYDVELSSTELGVEYRLAPRARLGVYGDSTRTRRAPAEICRNQEHRYRFDLAVGDWLGLRAKLSAGVARRGASAFRNATSNNPLTRRYHQAARDGRTWRAKIGYDFARVGASVDLSAECTSNVYRESVLGLQRDQHCARGGDIAVTPAKNVSFAAFYLHQETNSATAGRIGYAGPTWHYTTVDGVDTMGLRLDVRGLVDGRLELSVDVVRSLGAGRYVTEGGGEWLSFPDLVSNLTSVDLQAHYRMRRNSALIFQLRRERYAGEDWASAGAIDAIRNVLGFGDTSPRYATNLVGVTYVVALGRAKQAGVDGHDR